SLPGVFRHLLRRKKHAVLRVRVCFFAQIYSEFHRFHYQKLLLLSKFDHIYSPIRRRMAASYSPFYCNTNRLRITGGNTEDPAKSNRPAFCILLHGFFWSSRSSAISTPNTLANINSS